MAVCHLTNRRIDAYVPHSKTYIIRDRKVQGLCLAVNPGGSKSFLVQSTCKGRLLREVIGDAAALGLDKARAIATDRIAAFRREATARCRIGPDTAFAVVAGIAFERRERLWKPRTMTVNKEYLKLILPFFGEMAIGEIRHRHVAEWHGCLVRIPTSANRAAAVLSAVMAEAEAMGCRPEDTNPVRGLRRYKRRKSNRVPTAEEIGRLGRALAQEEKAFPRQVALIRLLALTGCRKSEMLELRWADYRDGNLHLVDSKSGPKTVFLSTPARKVLEGVKTRRWKWVFPSKRGDDPSSFPDPFWQRVRGNADLGWLRLHDLRHAYASFAIRNGVTLPMIGKLLGHGQAETTMRYAHLDDATMREAATKATAGMAVFGRAGQ